MKRNTRNWKGLIVRVVGILLLCCSGTSARTPDSAMTVKVETNDPAVIVRPGQKENARFRVQNQTDRRLDGTFKFGVRERPGAPEQFEEERSLVLAPGATKHRSLPTELIGDLGIKYLNWAFQGDRQSISGVTSFAHMEPVGATRRMQPVPPNSSDEFIFGMAGGIRVHMDQAFKRRFLKAAAIAGAEAYRSDMSWNHLQPGPDEWNLKGLDEMVKLARSFGMFIQPLVAYGNEWAVSDEVRERARKRAERDKIWQYPPRRKPWAQFNRKLAQRYGTNMQYYEIWNEADIFFWKGTADEYVDLLRTSYKAIKSVDRDILVTTCGFASMTHGEHNRDVLTETLTRGRDYFDVLAWHRHGNFDGFQREVDDHLLPLLNETNLSDRPLVFNETAMWRDFEREDELASILVKKMSFSWARGAIGHYWYNLMKSAPKYQMLNPDWTPRPSYPAYNQFARMLRGRHFSHQLDLGNGRWGFAFRGDGTFTGNDRNDWVVVLWTESEDSEPGDVSIRVHPDADAYRMDSMGNSASLPVQAPGTVRVGVDHDPVYLVIEDSSRKPKWITEGK